MLPECFVVQGEKAPQFPFQGDDKNGPSDEAPAYTFGNSSQLNAWKLQEGDVVVIIYSRKKIYIIVDDTYWPLHYSNRFKLTPSLSV